MMAFGCRGFSKCMSVYFRKQFSFYNMLANGCDACGKATCTKFFCQQRKIDRGGNPSVHPYLQNTLNMSYDFGLLHLSFADVEQDRKSAAEVHADVVLHLAHSYTVF